MLEIQMSLGRSSGLFLCLLAGPYSSHSTQMERIHFIFPWRRLDVYDNEDNSISLCGKVCLELELESLFLFLFCNFIGQAKHDQDLNLNIPGKLRWTNAPPTQSAFCNNPVARLEPQTNRAQYAFDNSLCGKAVWSRTILMSDISKKNKVIYLLIW